MSIKEFFRFTKLKIILLIVIGLLIFVSGKVSNATFSCIPESFSICRQPPTVIAGTFIYKILSFNNLFSLSFPPYPSMLGSFIHYRMSLKYSTIGILFDLLGSLVIWYLLISLIIIAIAKIKGKK